MSKENIENKKVQENITDDLTAEDNQNEEEIIDENELDDISLNDEEIQKIIDEKELENKKEDKIKKDDNEKIDDSETDTNKNENKTSKRIGDLIDKLKGRTSEVEELQKKIKEYENKLEKQQSISEVNVKTEEYTIDDLMTYKEEHQEKYLEALNNADMSTAQKYLKVINGVDRLIYKKQREQLDKYVENNKQKEYIKQMDQIHQNAYIEVSERIPELKDKKSLKYTTMVDLIKKVPELYNNKIGLLIAAFAADAIVNRDHIKEISPDAKRGVTAGFNSTSGEEIASTSSDDAKMLMKLQGKTFIRKVEEIVTSGKYNTYKPEDQQRIYKRYVKLQQS